MCGGGGRVEKLNGNMGAKVDFSSSFAGWGGGGTGPHSKLGTEKVAL